MIAQVSQLIPCSGIENIRDLGGIASVDGRTIKRRKLIRSAKLAKATVRDANLLVDTYGLSTIIDLRTPSEAAKSPDNIEAFANVEYVSLPLLEENEIGVARDVPLREIIASSSSIVKNPQEYMCGLYITLVTKPESTRAIKSLFDIMLKLPEDESMLWHCSAGKDRVGMTTALVLSALDVPERTIIDDYLATNDYLSKKNASISRKTRWIPSNAIRNSIAIVNSADETFIRAAFAEIFETYGSIKNYLLSAIGLSESDFLVLRDKFLEGKSF